MIRSAIFKLEASRATSCFFDGPVDYGVGDDLGVELLATLREALSNVARHARATRTDVQVVVTEEVVLRVVDDGVGPPGPDSPRGHGLRNMQARATRHGGQFDVGPGPGGGTAVEWRVPRR